MGSGHLRCALYWSGYILSPAFSQPRGCQTRVLLGCAAYHGQAFVPVGYRLISNALRHLAMIGEGRCCRKKSSGVFEANVSVPGNKTVARRLDSNAPEHMEGNKEVCTIGEPSVGVGGPEPLSGPLEATPKMREGEQGYVLCWCSCGFSHRKSHC